MNRPKSIKGILKLLPQEAWRQLNWLCLQSKHENPSSDPKNQYKKLVMASSASKPSTEEVELRGSLELAYQAVWLNQEMSGFIRDLVSKNSMESSRQTRLILSSVLHKQVHTYACVCVYSAV